MKSFLKFLKESKIDEELNSVEEEIFSIKENGEIEPVEENEDSFENILDDMFSECEISEDVKETKPIGGFGGEIYVNLDFDELNNDVSESENKKEKEMSNTLKTLTKRKEGEKDSIQKVKDRNTRYSIDNDGKNLLLRDPSDGQRKPLTKDQIKAVIDQKNKPSQGFGHNINKSYEFDNDGNLLGTYGDKKMIIPQRYHNRILKNLNDQVNSSGIHYRFKDGTSKMMINTTNWNKDGEQDDVRDNSRFDRAEYKDVETDDEKKSVLALLNQEIKTSKKKKRILGYENGEFTYDGKPLTSDELEKLVVSLNGNVGAPTKLLNPKGWGKKTEEYWKSYKISIAGSKIGNAVNFNLPPVVTCNKGVPCIKEGCYAIKCYAAYPAARSAMDCNLALLNEDENFELFKKSLTLALNTKGKIDGKRFNLCRVHVNGDIISKEYLRAICDVAEQCKHVNFWMYTKQYEMLSEFGTSYPDNLCIIVSCWGQFNPFDYKDGKYKDLAKHFPLAYLDDESEECKKLNLRIQEILGKPKDIQVCPCTEAEEIITRCESCKICFDRSLANNNLVFKKH